MNRAKRAGRNAVDLHEVEWIYPISFLPMVVYANHNNISINCYEENYSIDICNYLNSICFPEGTTKLSGVHKNYLPITRLACTTGNDILTKYEDRMIEKVDRENRNPFLYSLKYLTSELESNVREHARVKDYWIFSQYWSASRTCEIAICDTGIGYRASYVGTPFEVPRHIDAIINALAGKSSKSPQERGAGIPSIVNMFIEGYKGEMIMMSGDALLYLHQGEDMGYRLGLSWEGSFVGLRFVLKGINIYDYL